MRLAPEKTLLKASIAAATPTHAAGITSSTAAATAAATIRVTAAARAIRAAEVTDRYALQDGQGGDGHQRNRLTQRDHCLRRPLEHGGVAAAALPLLGGSRGHPSRRQVAQQAVDGPHQAGLQQVRQRLIRCDDAAAAPALGAHSSASTSAHTGAASAASRRGGGSSRLAATSDAAVSLEVAAPVRANGCETRSQFAGASSAAPIMLAYPNISCPPRSLCSRMTCGCSSSSQRAPASPFAPLTPPPAAPAACCALLLLLLPSAAAASSSSAAQRSRCTSGAASSSAAALSPTPGAMTSDRSQRALNTQYWAVAIAAVASSSSPASAATLGQGGADSTAALSADSTPLSRKAASSARWRAAVAAAPAAAVTACSAGQASASTHRTASASACSVAGAASWPHSSPAAARMAATAEPPPGIAITAMIADSAASTVAATTSTAVRAA
ncbi:hypothetical protein TSOC_006127 [Tetrabaena socialis]|uniref:Uncharacterized protein n=1 Tax=Tetrabaena socialis TaxID=47790 RepID=A0A2J8A4H0_9CHLO|nr:hypothetical protein TSOC_006127 [Tetrabaena socialis]|eukprot:PNH07421.1 hypothetical protein TSOC_006127 [Tetrabaena socialis]